MTHPKSLREYIEVLDRHGEIQQVSVEVDSHLEMGAITRRVYETGSPAPLFTKVWGVPQGFRAFGAPVGLSSQPGLELVRVALSLGLPPDASAATIVDKLAEAQNKPPIPPRLVETGPCKEHKWFGDDIDLNRFPAPYAHAGDGGRYLSTFGVIVARMPDGSWTNWSIARVMLVDRNHITGLVQATQHVGMVHAAWAKLGKPMPFALALGVPPAVAYAGGMPLPENVDEVGYVGAFTGEPVDVVRCETVDLEVPATSEIVIEGHISIERVQPEGPMGEYPGYTPTGGPQPQPLFEITAVTHRTDPILPFAIAGEPAEENHTVWCVSAMAVAMNKLREAGLPVTTVWSPLKSAAHIMVVTVPKDWKSRVQMTGEKFCHAIADNVFGTHWCDPIPRLVVINDDIDPSDVGEFLWGFATRCHPGAGEIAYGRQKTLPLLGFLTTAEKKHSITTKTVYNCLPPDDWQGELPTRSSFRYAYPRELQDKVLANWAHYGFAPPSPERMEQGSDIVATA